LSRRLALAAVLLAVSACHGDDNAVLLVVVTASGSPRGVTALEVRLKGPAGDSSNTYARDDQQPIAFPTTLSAELPKYATGSISIDVRARDAAGATVATGRGGPITLDPGDRETVYVRLDCDGDPCAVDGGMGGTGGDGNPPLSPSCGNGRIDPGETCDTAIAAGDPGACPSSCDDHIPCTTDTRMGSGCTVTCIHGEIRQDVPVGDGCCQAGAQDTDPDCSPSCRNGVVDPGETCDLTIPPGSAGACPTDCATGAPCSTGMLVSGGTCSAICVRYQIVTPSGTIEDTCCPPGATKAIDSDCPALCGDGVVESDESCDVAIPPRAPGACPTSCDDGDDCTIDYLSTGGCQAACQHFKITAMVSGDGCRPPGATHATDTDVPAKCGDGIVDPGETCDGNCPLLYCPPTPSACLRADLVGKAADCTARCVMTEVTTCELDKDGCCPAGCTNATDGDCSSRCGDGAIETTLGEVCDINAGPGPTACPMSCPDDGDPCTEERLLSAGTCAATCVHVPITDMRPGDGCCPRIPGTVVNFSLDPDCTPQCGNGIVERPVEICDYAAVTPATDEAPGSTGCPTSCPSDAACTRYVLQGRVDTCSAHCVAMPITACADDDSCCPTGCTIANDSDCGAICGDGVVSNNESCDRAITAGFPGACPRTCDDGSACTRDFASGSPAGCSRTCIHQPVTGCLSGDGCCPDGCNAGNDGDCNAQCGDQHIQAGETCDPPGTCPTTCPDDGDPCTSEQLTGSAAACTAACRHVPIIKCSGNDRDACCPTGCTAASDWDC
jgi:hypothetical protein